MGVLGVILLILKIIGIILLCVLGLALLIILLVLFTPISYKLSGVHNDDTTQAHIKVSFLIVSALADFVKGDGLDYKVKVLFFKVFSKDKNEKNDKKEKIAKKSKDKLKDDKEEFDGTTTDENMIFEDDFNSNDEVSEIETSNVKVDSDSGIDDIKDDKPKSKLKKLKNAKKIKDKSNKTPKGEKISLSDKIDSIFDKIYETLDNLDKKIDEGLVKLDHIGQFLDRDFVQRTIKRVLKVVKRLFGTIKPKKSKVYLRLGLGSAADTGMMVGRLSTMYPFIYKWLDLDPDFYNKVIMADGYIKGRIYLFRIVGPVLRILISRDFWRSYKLAKKI